MQIVCYVFFLLPVEGWSNLESMVSMQLVQEVTMLFKLIAAAKDSWACFSLKDLFLQSQFWEIYGNRFFSAVRDEKVQKILS